MASNLVTMVCELSSVPDLDMGKTMHVIMLSSLYVMVLEEPLHSDVRVPIVPGRRVSLAGLPRPGESLGRPPVSWHLPRLDGNECSTAVLEPEVKGFAHEDWLPSLHVSLLGPGRIERD